MHEQAIIALSTIGIVAIVCQWLPGLSAASAILCQSRNRELCVELADDGWIQQPSRGGHET